MLSQHETVKKAIATGEIIRHTTLPGIDPVFDDQSTFEVLASVAAQLHTQSVPDSTMSDNEAITTITTVLDQLVTAEQMELFQQQIEKSSNISNQLSTAYFCLAYVLDIQVQALANLTQITGLELLES